MENIIENTPSNKHKKKTFIVISLITLCIGLVVLGIFLILDVFREKEKEEGEKEATVIEHLIVEDYNAHVEDYNNETFTDGIYYVQKEDSNYKVISEIKTVYPELDIGYYKDKHYFIASDYESDEIIIRYIDTKDDYKIKNWISFPLISCRIANDCYSATVSRAKIIGDRLYMSLISSWNSYKGFIYFDMNATSLDEYNIIDDTLDFNQCYIDEKEENFYCQKSKLETTQIYKYIIATGTTEHIYDTYNYYDVSKYVQGNIVYYSADDDELSLYDLDTKTYTKISGGYSSLINKSGVSRGMFEVSEKYLYYYNGSGTIMKYDFTTKTSTLFYTMTDYSNFRVMRIVDDNTIEILDNDFVSYYVRDGVRSETIEFDLLLLDGTTKKIDINKILRSRF